MAAEREVHVHLVPELVAPDMLRGCIAVAVDVLRATTTIVYALANGCKEVRPCVDLDEARRLANSMRAGRVLLAGERAGLPLEGFDLGNSPRDFTASACKGVTLVLTTTNGTRAIERSAAADRVLIGAFVNYSALCEQLGEGTRPVHIVCAGNQAAPALEDTLLAGALIDFLCEAIEVRLNDSARFGVDCFENHGKVLREALGLGRGGEHLLSLGFAEDLDAAAAVDKFNIVPELRREPLRIEIGTVGIVKSRWRR